MKFHTRRPIALAAIILTASAALTACGSDDDGGDSGGGSEGGGELSITMLPKNLGNPYFDTSTDGAEAAAEELGVEHGPDRAVNGVVRRLADTRAAERDLGFRSTIDIEEGLRQLVEWWRPLRDEISAGRPVVTA